MDLRAFRGPKPWTGVHTCRLRTRCTEQRPLPEKKKKKNVLPLLAKLSGGEKGGGVFTHTHTPGELFAASVLDAQMSLHQGGLLPRVHLLLIGDQVLAGPRRRSPRRERDGDYRQLAAGAQLFGGADWIHEPRAADKCEHFPLSAPPYINQTRG